MATAINSAPPGVLKEATAPKAQNLKINPVNLVQGLACLTLALWAVKVDAFNNYSFGQTMGREAAQVAVLAALGLVILPGARMMQAAKGHEAVITWLFRSCILITVACAFLAYLNKAGIEMSTRAKANTEYSKASADAIAWREEAKRQRTRADTIAESRSVLALKPAVDRARLALKDAEGVAIAQKLVCVQARRCRDASTALSDLEKAAGLADGKAEALRLAREADEMAENADRLAKAGSPTEPQIYATLLSSWVGWDAGNVEKTARMGLAMLNIVITVLMSTIVGFALSCLGASIIRGGPDKPAPSGMRVRGRAGTQATVAGLLSQAHSPAPPTGLSAFMAKCEPSDEMTAHADIHAAVESWWKRTNQTGKLPTRPALKAALLAHGCAYRPNDKSLRLPAAYGVKLPAVKSPALAIVG